MASTSYSHLNHNTFDVFLSFRGEDTRYTFTDHLYEALRRAGIRAFRYNDDIDRGEELTPRIEKGIKESKAFIVVLSENYAKSKWCLKELMLILEERQNFGHFVLPVFYHVDPSDVRNQRRSYLIEADKGVEGSNLLNRWKAALREVGHLAGMVAEGPETDFIANIVDTINRKLDLKLVSSPAHLTAMETRAKYINSWLDNEKPGDDVLAICGMGGGGKTTLAQYIYNANKQKFESSCFLSDIGLERELPNGLLNLQKQLMTDIVGGKNTSLNSVNEGTRKIEAVLHMNRVLIVLDDIDDEKELDALLGTNCSHTKSKIIITTRLLNIQSWFESKSQRCDVYELKLLNDEESLELLSCCAFGSRIPMEGFEDLAAQLAQYCEGNPLALQVLGSSLYKTAKDRQKRNEILETWRSTLHSLNSSKGNVHSKIQIVLKRSYDSLPYDSEKELFLHVACFFVGEYKDYVATILEPDWHAKSGITSLINRCLLTISAGNKLIMHQLLQEMAKKIVNDSSRDAAGRSRVWNDRESYQMLCGEGSKTIEGLSLDMRRLKQSTRASAVNCKKYETILQEMAKKIVNDSSRDAAGRSRVWNDRESYQMLCGEGSKTIEGLSLDMRRLKQSTRASAVNCKKYETILQEMAKKIVNDSSRDAAGRSRVWNDRESYQMLCGEGSKTIEGLSLDMRRLKQSTRAPILAVETSSLSKMKNLKLLNFQPILAVETSSLSKMKNLKLLWLTDVELDGNYKKIPELRLLWWRKCHLKKVPSGLFMSSLVAIDMSNGLLEKFEPPVVLNSLKILNLKGCHKLHSVHSLYHLPNLESLILWDCSSLTYLSTAIRSLERLALLDLTGCKMLVDLEVGCLCGGGTHKRLDFSLPASLKFLFLNNLLPEDNVDVPMIQSYQSQPLFYINLGNSLFNFLPKYIDNVNLRVLDLTCCPYLESLIGLPSTLEELYTYRCTSLEKITFQSTRFKLRKFGYGGCTKLSEIQGLFKLVPIKELDEANLVLIERVKPYKDYLMDLVGDEITKRRIWHVQMLCEYDIRSTFLPAINQSMNMPVIGPPLFSFRVYFVRRRIDGILLTSLYRSTGDATDMSVLYAKISNKTKGLTWIYNPVVFGKPKVGEDVVWLSYWPNRNMLDFGDEIDVSIAGGNGLMVTRAHSEYVYGNVEQEDSINYNKEEEVIGGDLSEFELTRGVYYLCRRDFFNSASPADWLKMLIGDTFDYTELQGWRKFRETFDDELFMRLQTFKGNHCGVNEIIERSGPIPRW